MTATVGFHSQRLLGKVSVVTASTLGIGYAIAERLLREGSSVVISSRDQGNVDKAVATLRETVPNFPGQLVGRKCHVGSEEDRKALLEYTMDTFKKIDVLVSNHATNPIYGSILDLDQRAYDKIMDVNVKATVFLGIHAAKLMKPGGKIVIVSSIGGEHPLEGIGAYCISKTALFGVGKVLAKELGPKGLNVNVIAPGIIKTKFSEALHTNEKLVKHTIANTPVGRLGNPDDIAGVAAFLASDDSNFMTGEVLYATGGLCRL
jgi:dehydrogenase/reductase SDR family protein 4